MAHHDVLVLGGVGVDTITCVDELSVRSGDFLAVPPVHDYLAHSETTLRSASARSIRAPHSARTRWARRCWLRAVRHLLEGDHAADPARDGGHRPLHLPDRVGPGRVRVGIHGVRPDRRQNEGLT
jgi:hypothetical protein